MEALLLSLLGQNSINVPHLNPDDSLITPTQNSTLANYMLMNYGPVRYTIVSMTTGSSS